MSKARRLGREDEKGYYTELFDDISVTFTGIVVCIFLLPAIVLQFFLEYIQIPNFDTIYQGICIVAYVSAISLGLSIKFSKYKMCGIVTSIAIICAGVMTYKALKTELTTGIVDQKYERYDQQSKKHIMCVYIWQNGDLNQYECNRDDWLELKKGQTIEFKVAMDYITKVY